MKTLLRNLAIAGLTVCLSATAFAQETTTSGDGGSVLVGVNSRGCSYLPTAVIDDSNFKEHTWHLSILVAVFLPAIYVIGLIFTLRTLLLAGTTTVTRRYAPTQLASVALSALGDLEE